jgi:hypothetical protein
MNEPLKGAFVTGAGTVDRVLDKHRNPIGEENRKNDEGQQNPESSFIPHAKIYQDGNIKGSPDHFHAQDVHYFVPEWGMD